MLKTLIVKVQSPQSTATFALNVQPQNYAKLFIYIN